MRIHIVSTPPRRRPKAGDRKTIKGVEHVAVFQRCTLGPGAGAIIVSNGRPRLKWVPAENVTPMPASKEG